MYGILSVSILTEIDTLRKYIFKEHKSIVILHVFLTLEQNKYKLEKIVHLNTF